MSWHQLNSPRHAESLSKRGHTMIGFAEILRELAVKDFASQFFGHWSHDRFTIGTAASYHASLDTPLSDILTIEQGRGATFLVGFADGVGSGFGWSRESDRAIFKGCLRECRSDQVVSLVDEVIRKLLPPVECGLAQEKSMNCNRTLAPKVGQADADKAAVLSH